MTNSSILTGPQSQELIGSLASAFGISPEKAAPAYAAMSDDLVARVQRLMLSRGGLAEVTGLLTGASAAATKVDAGSLAGAELQGNRVLEVLNGDKHISRGMAARAARASGVDEGLAKKMLPVVANMMMGSLRQNAGNELDHVARAVSAGAPRGPIDAGGPLPVPGDNIPGLGRQRAPANNPFENLPDIIRRGGVQVPSGGGVGGGALENVIRSVLGNLLGGNRGVIGTMIQLFLVRWITNVVRRMLGGR